MEAGFVSCCLECLNKTVMLQFRIEDKNCGTEIWTLSANAALVGHTLWMDHMQDASLQGVPESRKLVALVIGNTIYGNSISVKRNLKSYLCEMGLPFLLPNTSAFLLQKIFQSVCGFRTHRSGWILKWRIAHLYQICKDFFIQAELVPAFRQMHESMSK